jgi:hypothetical protein
MKTFVSAIVVLCFAAIVIGCSNEAEESLVPSVVTNYDAPVTTTTAAIPEATLAVEPAEEASPNLDEVAPESEAAVTCLAKSGEVLYVGGRAGVTAITDGKPERIIEGETVALIATHDKIWAVQPGMLRTTDGATQIVPEFGARLSSAAATDLAL